jgi:hypothetical protein
MPGLQPGPRLEMQLSSGPPAGDVLSMWQAVAPRGGGPVQAGAGVIWSVDLPARPRDASRLMEDRLKRVGAIVAELPGLEQRLAAFSQAPGLPWQQPDYAMEGFARPAPENELRDLLLTLQGQMPAGAGPEPAFGVLDFWNDLQQAARDAADLFNLLRQFGSDDWVVTRQAGALLGCTALAWNGDLETYWVPGIPMAQFALHRQHLQASLEGRMLLTRVGLLTATSAVRLAAQLLVSANPFLLPGAVLRFIRQLLQEYHAYKGA